MQEQFELDIEKTINSILFILEKCGGKCDFHKIFKILYFADQKHLAEFGMPISGDQYIAMKDGPVPSKMYDLFKYLRGDSYWHTPQEGAYHDLFEVKDRFFVIAKQLPDMDELAESNIECLLASIAENKDLNYNNLAAKSHSKAWENAKGNNEMSTIDIALEGGADEEMVKYIKLNLENQNLISHHAESR